MPLCFHDNTLSCRRRRLRCAHRSGSVWMMTRVSRRAEPLT